MPPGCAALHVQTCGQGYHGQPRLHRGTDHTGAWHSSWHKLARLYKLHSNTASQAETQLDPLAQLEDTLALTAEEPEQEAATASQLVPALAPVPAPSHDSVACQQQVETAVKRMWDMVADNDEMQQHLVSQLNRTEGALSKIQASHQNGSAHPMARLSRVQDTWGNSLARKKVIGLDAGFPKSKHSKTALQPAA